MGAVAVEAVDLQEGAATGLQDARARRGHAELRQGFEGQVFAHQQVGPAARAGRVVQARELDQHVLGAAVGAPHRGRELGELARGAGACVARLHGLGGALQPGGGAAGLGRGLRVGLGLQPLGRPALVGGFAHDEVARRVGAQQRQGVQRVVIRPVAGVFGHLQQGGVCAGEGAAQEAVGAHVLQGAGQAFVPAVAHGAVAGRERPGRQGVARAGGAFQPAPVALGQVQPGQQARFAQLVDLEDRQGCPLAAQRPPGRVGAPTRLPHGDDLLTRLLNRPHQRGSADAQVRHHLPGWHACGAARQPGLLAQVGDQGGVIHLASVTKSSAFDFVVYRCLMRCMRPLPPST